MQSKAMFDIDHANNPVVKLEIVPTSDVRDKIAKRFIETLGKGESQWCEIFPSGEGQYIIWPITGDQFRRTAEHLIARADQFERHLQDRSGVTEAK